MDRLGLYKLFRVRSLQRSKFMRKVFLITGFNNWGKTFLIKKMFHQKIYHYNKLYKFLDINFCVQPQSNDDFKKD